MAARVLPGWMGGWARAECAGCSAVVVNKLQPKRGEEGEDQQQQEDEQEQPNLRPLAATGLRKWRHKAAAERVSAEQAAQAELNRTLFKACVQGDAAEVARLLGLGAQLDATNKAGENVLQCAVGRSKNKVEF